MAFERAISNLKVLSQSLDGIFVEVMKDNESEIIDLNISQLESGQTSEGDFIEPDYATDEYADLKKSIGSKSPKGTPDVKLEGDFYEGFEVNVIGNDRIEIDSSDEKTSDLERKYDNIFGLTDKNLEIPAELFQDKLIQKLKDVNI